jgi:hypothetical protein
MYSPFNHFIGGNGRIGEISKALLDIFNGEYGMFISVDPEHGSDKAIYEVSFHIYTKILTTISSKSSQFA